MNNTFTTIMRESDETDIEVYYNKKLSIFDILVDPHCIPDPNFIQDNNPNSEPEMCKHQVMIKGNMLRGYFSGDEICDLYVTNNLAIPEHFKKYEVVDDIIIYG